MGKDGRKRYVNFMRLCFFYICIVLPSAAYYAVVLLAGTASYVR